MGNSGTHPKLTCSTKKYDLTKKSHHQNQICEKNNEKLKYLSSSCIASSNSNLSMVIAMYNYTAKEDGELSFRKGDHLIILDNTNADWYLARHENSNKKGYVPRNYMAFEAIETEEWFFGNISRREAENLLLNSNSMSGSYLIRNSENSEGYSLSILDWEPVKGYCVKHYKIQLDGNGNYFMTIQETFKTINELVGYYSKNANGLCHNLTKPISKSKPIYWPNKSDEINREDLKFIRKLGKGSFGEVYYGKYKNLNEVAIKVLKPNTMSTHAFLEEAAIMRKYRHDKLVALYGICSQEEPLLIITEFMCNGCLLDYLRNNEKNKNLKTNELLDIAAQIALGMSYLEDQKLIHRDLAARNILVGKKQNVKVADFGLARLLEESEYTAQEGVKIPIKWTAPEALIHRKFTTKSDVWSYGILLYEIFTYGQIPYPGMNNREVIEQVVKGYRMPKPPNHNLPSLIYNQMLQCWHDDSNQRPTFKYLYRFLDGFLVTKELN